MCLPALRAPVICPRFGRAHCPTRVGHYVIRLQITWWRLLKLGRYYHNSGTDGPTDRAPSQVRLGDLAVATARTILQAGNISQTPATNNKTGGGASRYSWAID